MSNDNYSYFDDCVAFNEPKTFFLWENMCKYNLGKTVSQNFKLLWIITLLKVVKLTWNVDYHSEYYSVVVVE